jgi:multimeric flavodoxin WrbA
MRETVLVLDGENPGGADLGAARAALLRELEERGSQARLVTLREEALAHCRGCFGCWVETPGLCRSRDRSGPLLQALLASDTVVLLTPSTFGGYGSTAKRFVDHWVQTALPFFRRFRGETHHPSRYGSFPRLVALGVSEQPDVTEERLLQALVARNAANFGAPSAAAGLVPAGDPAPAIRRILDARLSLALTTVPVSEGRPWRDGTQGRALLLVGSPKTDRPSTSAELGGRVLKGLESSGWSVESLTLGPDLKAASGRDPLFRAAEAADLILLAFPLYIDSLPCLATLALEQLATRPLAGKALAVIVNNGFPEARQNEVALAIAARFAEAAGMVWAGALALGAGEALCSGEPLAPRPGGNRPPVGHVLAGVERAARALAEGRPIPPDASARMDRSPIPGLPFRAWVFLFRVLGGRGWRQMAKAKGVRDLAARPLV